MDAHCLRWGADTDGDGFNDKQEFDDGSDPNDPNDNGPPPDGVVNARFTMGDGSASSSEMYGFSLEPMDGAPGPIHEFGNSEYGIVENFYVKLRKGVKYKLVMWHIGTSEEAMAANPSKKWPDYDYTMSVDETRPVFVVDPYVGSPHNHPMLGDHSSDDDEHFNGFWPANKEC